MAISRTIMQEQAPADQRSRVMSFHAFSFMGAGPVGALLCGFLVELFGPRQSLMICAAAMIAVMLGLTVFSRLWGLHSHQLQVE